MSTSFNLIFDQYMFVVNHSYMDIVKSNLKGYTCKII